MRLEQRCLPSFNWPDANHKTRRELEWPEQQRKRGREDVGTDANGMACEASAHVGMQVNGAWANAVHPERVGCDQ